MKPGAALLAVLLALAGCAKPPPASRPHYVLGGAWQAEGVWHYPTKNFELAETGLAAIQPSGHPKLTTDGEVFDPAALAGAHQTLQLPAIARITNLETGLQLMMRINDRGPANPGRMLAVTPRVATLLEFPSAGVARVRLEVLQAESREAAASVEGGNAVNLDVATAPRAPVQRESLAPPQGMRGAVRPDGAAQTAVASPEIAPAAQTLPETVTRVMPEPGQIRLRLGSFSRAEFARMQLVRVSALGARIEPVRNGRSIEYRVIIGPYSRVSDADSALARVIAAGITDARIVIE